MVVDETEGRENHGTNAVSTIASEGDMPSQQVDNYHMEKGKHIHPHRRKPDLQAWDLNHFATVDVWRRDETSPRSAGHCFECHPKFLSWLLPLCPGEWIVF
jgi:protein-disulfide isomerase-like protein with CxxC motif